MDISRYLWRPADIAGCYLFGPRFIGGHGVEEVLRRGADLKKQGYRVTYSILGEHIHDPRLVAKAAETIINLIQSMNQDNSGNVACKPTLYGLAISKEYFRDTLRGVLNSAREKRIEIEIDAENYQYIPDTFDVFRYFSSLIHYRNFVRQAVQAHLKNIFALMDVYGLWDKRLRVVKGSGMHPEDADMSEKSPHKIRENYLDILRRSIHNMKFPFAATVRDKKLVDDIIGATRGNKYLIEFELLYGPLGRRLGETLLRRRGYLTRIYIPFVVDSMRDAWKPYALRRAAMARHLMWEEMKNGLFGKFSRRR